MIRLNGVHVIPTIFPDKTSQVWKLDDVFTPMKALVEWDFESEAEFMHLAQLKHLLDIYAAKTTLRLSYLPYARQDKAVSNANTFALTTFAKLLNSLNFTKIIIVDPHSHHGTELFYNASAEYPIKAVRQAFADTISDIACYPDAGARSKYSFTYPFPSTYATKVRDPATGQLSDPKLGYEADVVGKNVLMVDDICDGGGTFIQLTKVLLTSGAKAVNLFVTHGIFSKGLAPLREAGIARIFTKDGEKL